MKHEEAMQILQMYKDEIRQRIDKANAPEVKDVYQWQMDGFDMAIDALNQTAWIPVGERLPEEYGEYLVTKRTIGWNYEEYGSNDIAYFDSDGFHKADKVTAWMPLPEAYKGG